MNLAEALISLRLVHDEAAVAQMREGARTTLAVHLAGMAATTPGVPESYVRAAMEARPLVNYTTRPLWLVAGQDRAGSDFVTGFSPAVPRWAGTRTEQD